MKKNAAGEKKNYLVSTRLHYAIISLTSRCNLRCAYCAVSQPEYRGTDFDSGKIDGLIDEILAFGVDIVQVSGHGETTSFPHWHDLCGRLLDKSIALTITSNFARVFDDEEVNVLARMNFIIISVDTARSGLFARLRRGASLETVLRNMENIRGRADELGRETYLIWQNTLSDLVVPHLKEYVRAGLAAGVRQFNFSNLIEHKPIPGVLRVRHPSTLPADRLVGLVRTFHELKARIRGMGAKLYIQPGMEERINEALGAAGLPRARLGERYAPILAEKVTAPVAAAPVPGGPGRKARDSQTRFCTDPWNSPYIHPNGDVWPCCWFGDSLGNIYQGRFRDIWNGRIARRLRLELLSGKLRKQCRDCLCSSWTSRDKLASRVQGLPPSKFSAGKASFLRALYDKVRLKTM